MNLLSLAGLLVSLALWLSGAAFSVVHVGKSPSTPGPSDPTAPTVAKGEGIVTKPSHHSVDETVAKLKSRSYARARKRV